MTADADNVEKTGETHLLRSWYDREESISDSKNAKRRPGRLHKWIGDTCLLLGSPKVLVLVLVLVLCLVFVFSFGFVCFGLAWLGLAWLGLAWLGLAWLGLSWLGLSCLVWIGLRFGLIQVGLVGLG